MTEFDIFFKELSQSDVDKEKTNTCQSCSCELYVYDGMNTCLNCGDVYDTQIDETAEWKLYGSEDHRTSDPTRCGASRHPILVDSSFGTTIKYSSNPVYNRLRQLSNWNSQSHFERAAREVFSTLSYIGQSAGLTNNIIEYSQRLYYEAKKIQNSNPEYTSSRGDFRSGLIAACLAQSCKEFDVTRSEAEIALMCDIHSSDFTRGKNLFNELMKHSEYIDIDKDILKYSDFTERYCLSLDLNDEQTERIKNFSNRVYSMKILTKHTPESMICGCIYFVSIMYNYGISKDEISQKCGTSKPTISKVYEKLIPHTADLI